jgi:CheY-like chemotaxis protein
LPSRGSAKIADQRGRLQEISERRAVPKRRTGTSFHRCATLFQGRRNPSAIARLLSVPAWEKAIPQVSSNSQAKAQQTILVVEDEVLIRLDVSEQLRSSGFRVVEAKSGDEAVALLENARIDAIVTDLRMPGSIDGRELVLWTRIRCPTAKIIVVSAHAEPFSNGAPDVILAKPVRIEQLLHALREILPPAEPV